MPIKTTLQRLLRRRGKVAFLKSLPDHARILDVGCGNDSPFAVKSILPHSHYTGVDVADYRQKHPEAADAYIITSPEAFDMELAALKGPFSAIISSHNLEHCNDREATLKAICRNAAPGTRLYLSFPSRESLSFPKRGGLNYYDDPQHRDEPPDFEWVCAEIQKAGFRVEHAVRGYRPTILRLIGSVLEPVSILLRKPLLGTWESYGFETIIWARKG